LWSEKSKALGFSRRIRYAAPDMAELILADGTRFAGRSFGAECDADGEVVFNTGMVGYPESMTDPSYVGQILVFTYPLIGNYGVPEEALNEFGFSKNLESENVHVRAIVVSNVSDTFSHWNAKSSLQDWMKKHGIPGITGVDTRALTKKLREHGVMLGAVKQEEGSDARAIMESMDDPNQRNLVADVSVDRVTTYEPSGWSEQRPTIVAYDCGMKRNISRSFLHRGVRVHRVPWDFDLTTSHLSYDGVFISNGPGDPKSCVKTIEQIKHALSKNIPTFGICLGNQLLALAIGADTYKLKYGHRGANQPCKEVGTDRCIVTSQNHGFAVSDKLPTDWSVWFENANDGSVEGIRHSSGRFFSVQFHPEATPGPEDANYLFDDFVAILEKE
jgi:carbamoyl-phosphate synthase small subunit